MSNSNYSQNIVWTGLGTYTTKVMDAGIYKVSGHIDLPLNVIKASFSISCGP